MFVLFWAAVLLFVLSVPVTGQDSLYQIQVGGARLTPEAGSLDLLDHIDDRLFLAQFQRIPDQQVRLELERSGLRFESYVGGNTYLARCTQGSCPEAKSLSMLRAAIELTAEMKRSEAFDRDPSLVQRWARGDSWLVRLRFAPTVTLDQARAVLDNYGAKQLQEAFGSDHGLRIEVSREQLEALLHRPEVEWADPALPPAMPATDSIVQRTHVDLVQGRARFKGANGRGVRIAVMDRFSSETHRDLEGRVTRVRADVDESNHGIAMSGIIAGSGKNVRRAKGMAPKARLYWYTTEFDPWDEMRRDRDRYGFNIMSNSWGSTAGWYYASLDFENGMWVWFDADWSWGYYHSLTRATDKTLREIDLLAVFAAANQRQRTYMGPHWHATAFGDSDLVTYDDHHLPNPEFSSITVHASAKNVLTVGGTTKEDAMTHFASWGPTRDGRIKPDVVGTSLDNLTLAHENATMGGSGTSNATAATSGTAALLTDYFRRRHKADPSALALKALLIHSARDLGLAGPDFIYGHGLVDAEMAAEVVRSAVLTKKKLQKKKSPRSLIFHQELDHRRSRSVKFKLTKPVTELRATLVWHDAAGKKLVNDLDLWLLSPAGKRIRPLVANAKQPQAAARRRRNKVDNVERIVVPDPQAGTWTLVVNAKKVPMGPQTYVLIASAGNGNRPPVIYEEGTCGIGDLFTTGSWYDSDSVAEKSRFNHGERFSIHMRPSLSDNPDYGDFYGSVLGTFIVRNSNGKVMLYDFYETHAHDRLEPRRNGIYTQTGSDIALYIPNGLPVGRYTAEGVFSLPNGCRATASYPFRID